MAWWNRKKDNRNAVEERLSIIEDLLIGIPIDLSTITREQALSIPAVNMAVNLIADTVASLPIRLYQEDEAKEKVDSVEDDPRVKLLNIETGDTLDAYQFKKAMVVDYLLMGAGYAYIDKQRNNVQSLHYVDNRQVSVVSDPNPIWKKNEFIVFGETYKDFEFIKLTRKTFNGAVGFGVLQENNKALSIAYNMMLFEDMLYRTGGNRKGFLKSQNRLSPDAIKELKASFANLYSNNTENVVVLNSGIDWQESNQSSVELQLNSNKVSGNDDIAKMFGIPVEVMSGKVTQVDMLHDLFIRMAVLPILKAFETALNKDLLLDKEKGSFYFEFDTNALFKGDIQKRFAAYQVAIANGILKIDEVRKLEGYESLNLDFIKLTLGDILYNPETKEVYVPNTGETKNPNDPPADGETPRAGKASSEEVIQNESGNPGK